VDTTPQTTLVEDQAPEPGTALSIRRFFTSPGVHPFDSVEWETRDAFIGHGGNVAFEQKDVEFPKTWSQNATNIVAQKYFRGQLDSPARERSVKQMIGRVAGTIADWGRARGYFATTEDGDTFEAELTHILLHQMAAFNSPVWFNVGFGRTRSARPASSSLSRTRWTRSSTGTPRKAGSSAVARARASTSAASVARWSR
jgi:ribonucleoside-diphosphate reductase alpha chain